MIELFVPFIHISEKKKELPFEQISLYIEEIPFISDDEIKEEEKVIILDILQLFVS